MCGFIHNNMDQIDTYAYNVSLASMKQYNTSIPDDIVTSRWNFVQINVKDIYLFIFNMYFNFMYLFNFKHSNGIICFCLILQLQCCGVREPKDWKTITNNSNLPWSCCGQEQNNNCTLESLDKSRFVGCLCKLKEILNEKSDLIIWFFMGFITIQVYL